MAPAPNKTLKQAVLKSSNHQAETQAKAALEQMFGYFSFELMPTERADERLAA